MKRTAWVVAPIFVLLIGAAPALATGSHHEQQDGCDHGHTGKPCRPDPQPDHGKDCELHGNHGGINEDHCSTTTTTELTTTTTTAAPTSTTTTATIETGSTATTAPSTTSTTSLSLSTPAPERFAAPVEMIDAATLTNPAADSLAVDELPRTGWDAGFLFVIGMAVFCAGLSTWFAAKVL